MSCENKKCKWHLNSIFPCHRKTVGTKVHAFKRTLYVIRIIQFEFINAIYLCNFVIIVYVCHQNNIVYCNRHVSILPASISSAILQVVCICNLFCECKQIKLDCQCQNIAENTNHHIHEQKKNTHMQLFRSRHFGENQRY